MCWTSRRAHGLTQFRFVNVISYIRPFASSGVCANCAQTTLMLYQGDLTAAQAPMHEQPPEAQLIAVQELADVAARELLPWLAERREALRVTPLDLPDFANSRLQEFMSSAAPNARLLCAFIQRLAANAAAAARGGAKQRPGSEAHVAFAVAHALHACDPRFKLEYGHKLAFLIKTMSLSAAIADILSVALPGAPNNRSMAASIRRQVKVVRARGANVRQDAVVVACYDNIGGGGSYVTKTTRTSIRLTRIPRVWTSRSVMAFPGRVGDLNIQQRQDLAPYSWPAVAPPEGLLECSDAESGWLVAEMRRAHRCARESVSESRAENGGVDPVQAEAAKPRKVRGVTIAPPGCPCALCTSRGRLGVCALYWLVLEPSTKPARAPARPWQPPPPAELPIICPRWSATACACLV